MPGAKDIIVGVDLGGTSLRAMVVDRENKILAVVKTPTKVSDDAGELIQEMADTVDEAVRSAGLTRKEILAVGIGAPGSVDRARGTVYDAPNLRWEAVPLGPELEKLLRLPVLVDNDVNAGIVGEHELGAARGAQEVVGIFVGTGIGGGIISRGQLYEGSRGAAGEIGHMVLQVDGPLCSCGRRGCAEALASRSAMERDVRAAIKAGKRSSVLKIMKEHRRRRMTSAIIARALKKKDPVMRRVMKRAEHFLGILVGNVINVLDPECVVIGGGIADRLRDDFVAPIRKTALKNLVYTRHLDRIRIVPGSLGDSAGALGAVILARQRLRKSALST